MTRRILLAVLTLVALAFATHLGESEAAWRHPAIQGYGKVEPIPGGALAPKKGVRYVCGQALAHAGFSRNEVSHDIDVAQAAITATAELQRRGYHLQSL